MPSAARTELPPPPLRPLLCLTNPGYPWGGQTAGPGQSLWLPRAKEQAGDRSTEFFKALMEPASQDLGAWDAGGVLGDPSLSIAVVSSFRSWGSGETFF